jgi:hypothetical protein
MSARVCLLQLLAACVGGVTHLDSEAEVAASREALIGQLEFLRMSAHIEHTHTQRTQAKQWARVSSHDEGSLQKQRTNSESVSAYVCC